MELEADKREEIKQRDEETKKRKEVFLLERRKHARQGIIKA